MMLEHEIIRQDIANEINEASRTRLGKARFPQRKSFDPSYQISHHEQLLQRQAREKAARAARKGKGQAVGPPEVSNLVSMQAGPSITHSLNGSLFKCTSMKIHRSSGTAM